ncbi:MAG: SpoIIE family protein phosphatase [Candidatus Krumholzibacteriota bacterium]|nr:SpoIIE family protein phosphatase [Candidatus Krumholzibacteriota bacterium]
MTDSRQTERAAGAGRKDRRPRIIGMRLIVTSGTVALLAAGVLGVGALGERRSRQVLAGEIETRLRLQARNLALMSSGALLSEYPELTLHPLVKEMQADLPELAFVLVVDHEGVIQGHQDARSLGEIYVPDPGLAALDSLSAGGGARLLGSAELLVAAAPVMHPNGEQAIGQALVGLPRDYISRLVEAARSQQLLLVATVLGLGVLAALVLMGRLLRPMDALRAGLERIGRGDLDTPIALRARTELGLLAEAVDEMAAELKSAQVTLVESGRLAHEMELARDIQRNLLPAGHLDAGGCRVTGAHRAAAEVGGDYYDFFALPDGRVAVAIADVSGKGLAGCLIMSMLSALLRSYQGDFGSPAALLVMLEHQLQDTLKLGQFVTMFYGVLDPDSGELRYASAGHSPLLIHRAATGEVEWHHTRGIPLGAVAGGALATTLEDARLLLAPGDLLVQYTDGINESFAPDGEQFDFSRIETVVREHAAAGGEAVLAALRRAVHDWTGRDAPDDDETLLVIQRDAAAPGAREVAPTAAAAGGDPAGKTVVGPGGDPGGDAAAAVSLPPGHGVMDLQRRLPEAQARGVHLELPARLDALPRLHLWLADCPTLDALPVVDRQLVENALYEICANIVEHGYQEDAGATLDVWWVPAGGADPLADEPLPDQAAPRLAASLGEAYFLLRDACPPFRPGPWQASDLSDPGIRRRGRGLGLDIVHRIVSRVVYQPTTPQGNLTLLQFDPEPDPNPKVVHHV